ncbi:hypothetical protein MIR68_003072 [Amoeboaphelidium protococcarum]|nr:hypothetical protein MIR68_003072 [Amoeboaphelidium protococcarum]
MPQFEDYNDVVGRLEKMIEFEKDYSFIYANNLNFSLLEQYQSKCLLQEWIQTVPIDNVLRLLAEGDNALGGITDESFTKFFSSYQSLKLDREQQLMHTPPQEINDKLRFGMKPKKVHEVQIYSALISQLHQDLMQQDNCNCTLVDCGAGQGYLAGVLSCQYGHRVIALDNSQVQIDGVIRRLTQLEKMSRKDSNITFKSLTFIQTEIDESTDFDRTVTAQYKILYGLHACGDLTSTMISKFVDTQSIKGLAVAGCCYQWIKQYPMSQVARNQSHEISFAGLKAATFPADLDAESCHDSVERLVWRAMLQVYLHDHCGHDNFQILKYQVGKIRQQNLDFPAYCHLALKRILPDHIPNTKVIQSIYDQQYRRGYDKIYKLHAFRILIGRINEEIVALDRVAYLHEQSQSAGIRNIRLIPLFEMKHSPRNMVILANR